MPAALEMGDQRPAAGQADLAAVRVAAEIERVARGVGIVGDLRGMHQGDAELAVVLAERRQRCLGVEAVDVVQSGDAQAVVAAPQEDRAIDQDVEAHPLEQAGHRRRIVIAQHGEARTPHANAGQRLHQQSGRTLDRRPRMAVDVAGDGQHVDFDTIQQRPRRCREFGQVVEMGIAQLQDAIAVECRRQARQLELELDLAQVEGVAPAESVDRRQAQHSIQHRDDDLESALAPAAVRAGTTDQVPAVLDGAPSCGPILHGTGRPNTGRNGAPLTTP